MRVFLAIDLDDHARAAAAAWAQALSTRLGATVAREIKWVETANLHLSVHFFGELSDAQVGALRRLLAVPYDTRAFALALAGAGTFPPSGSTRVIWLGVRETQNTGGMQAVYDQVQRRLATIGLEETSTRSFTPHLTIGRVRTPGANLTRALRPAMTDTPAPAPTFLVAHLTLYQSRLSPKGPTYLPIAQFMLSS
jgi:RNA 2',3'-cyclic 3'-phosphodiesterase